MSVVIENGDIIFVGNDRFEIKLNCAFAKFFIKSDYFRWRHDPACNLLTNKSTVVEALSAFLIVTKESAENYVLMIERNETGCIRKEEEEHPAVVVPLSYQQMKQKYLNKEIPKVNEQIEKTFDGYSARVLNLQPAVRDVFEKHGWEIRVVNNDKEFVFSPK